MLLNNQWIIEEIKEEIKKIWKPMKTQQSKIYRTQKKQFKRDIHSDKSLSQETRKISNKQPILTLKGTRKEE